MIAAAQIYLAHTAHLTPWKGGGFGMFSTLDRKSDRYIRVFVTALERTEEFELDKSWKNLTDRIRTLPADFYLLELSEAVTKKLRGQGLPVEVLRIEVWRTEYRKGDLNPIEFNLSNYTYLAGAE